MLTIRAEQLKELAKVPKRVFVEEHVRYARRVRPDLYERMAAADLSQLVNQIIDFADDHEIFFRNDVTRFVRCVLALDKAHETVAADPAAMVVIRDLGLSGADKARWLETHSTVVERG